MNTNDVNTYLLQAAQACVDQENHKGAIVAGYFAADADAHNGVMVTGKIGLPRANPRGRLRSPS